MIAARDYTPDNFNGLDEVTEEQYIEELSPDFGDLPDADGMRTARTKKKKKSRRVTTFKMTTKKTPRAYHANTI